MHSEDAGRIRFLPVPRRNDMNWVTSPAVCVLTDGMVVCEDTDGGG
jgi:hypothetical protein